MPKGNTQWKTLRWNFLYTPWNLITYNGIQLQFFHRK